MTRSVRPRTRTVVVVAALVAALGLVALPAAPAFAAPVPPSFGLPPEGYAPSDPQSTCDPVAKPGVVDFRDLLNQTYGTHPSGITRSCSVGGTSEHKEGRALDYMLDVNNATERAVAGDILAWLFATDQFGENHAMARRLGMMYIIWDRKIWSAARASEGWRNRPCDGTPNDCHTNHIHFSVSWAGAFRQTSWWTGRQPGVTSVVYNGVPRFFARGVDGKLVQYYLENGMWRWQTVLDGRIVGTPGAVVVNGMLMVFVTGTDGTPWWYTFNGTWDMSPINVGKITSGVSAVSFFGGPRFFARGLDGQLIQYFFQNDQWQWQALGGSIVGTPGAVVDNGVLKVFVTGTDGTPFQYTHGSSWSPPVALNDCGKTSGGVGAVVYTGVLRFFARGLGGELVQCFYQNGDWHRQIPIVGNIVGQPGAVVDGTTLRVFASGTDGTPWEFFFTTGWDRRAVTGKIA